MTPHGTLRPLPAEWVGTSCDMGGCNAQGSYAVWCPGSHGWLPACRSCALREERLRVARHVLERHRVTVAKVRLASEAGDSRKWRVRLDCGQLLYVAVRGIMILSVAIPAVQRVRKGAGA